MKYFMQDQVKPEEKISEIMKEDEHFFMGSGILFSVMVVLSVSLFYIK